VIAGILLLADIGSRLGGAAPLFEPSGSRRLLEHALRVMTAAPLSPVVVVLGSGADDVLPAVELYGARPVARDRWKEGQAASLACGLAEVPDAEAALVALGDERHVSVAAIRRVLAARSDDVLAVRATYDGEPGHPVLLERRLFGPLRDVTGDHGARNLLLSVPVREVPCDDLGGGENAGTRAQLEALRESLG